ncbi:MAG: TonB-dependent receptor [Pseudomonadota bacterium]|nr:TonB-dependent receptor [Pseudomonadota bacterium]MDO7710649.1 TonB-dependent receptor [Pseudomonadota bacterium]
MMFSLRKISLLVAVASSCASPVVFAEGEVALDSLVVTGTRSETSLLDLAGNTGKISEEEIDFVRADHITEVLNRLPGVMVQRGNGQEHLTSIRSPILNGGAGAGSFLYLEDGVPMRAAGFANVNGLFEANAEQAGGIEVVKGPGSALYGSNAVHGLINVLSRAPSLDLERSIDVSVGPHDLYSTKATVSDTIGNQAYRFSLNGTHDGGWIDDSGFDQQKMTFRHDYYGEKDTFKTVFNASNLNQETAGYEVGTEAYKNTVASKTNEYPEAYRDAKSARLSMRWDHELRDDAYFSLTPYIRHTEMNFLMHFLPGTPVEENEHDSVGLLAAYYKDLEGGHKIIVGTDFEYTEGSLSEVQNDPNTYTFGKYVPGVHYDYDVDATVIAPYIHTEWQVAENTRITAGARYEHTRYEYDNKTADGLTGTKIYRPADRDDTYNNFSPKLGLVQSLTEDTSAFINLARGNRAPQTTDLYRQRKESNNVLQADSETIDSLEIGIRKLGAGIQYEVSSFYMKKKNYFFRTTADDNVPDGKTKHYGIELSMFAPLGEQFDLGGSLTYARHQYEFDNETANIVDGNDMDTAPRHIANVRLGWNFKPQSRAELEWVHVGQYYTDEGNAQTYDGHDLLNLRATHHLSHDVTVYGRISNLLNTEYAERADYSGFAGDRYFVGEERGLHVGASYSF